MSRSILFLAALLLVSPALAADGTDTNSGTTNNGTEETGKEGLDKAAALPEAAAKIRETRQPTNTVLLRLFEQDQADREARLPASALTQRDSERRNTAKKVLAKATLKTADDFYHAAVIFQHGTNASDFAKARSLALKALELDNDHSLARWVAAAAEDRRLMAIGKPQLYGTQFKATDGHWELYDVDPRITDAERAKWNVPPLRDAKRRVEAMNDR